MYCSILCNRFIIIIKLIDFQPFKQKNVRWTWIISRRLGPSQFMIITVKIQTILVESLIFVLLDENLLDGVGKEV
jgi:hypothetical protein